MPTPLKQRQLKQRQLKQQEQEQVSQQKFQEFQDLNGHSSKLKELIFFARIAVFSLITVLFAFVLLVMNLAPVWAFLIASAISLVITSFLSKAITLLMS